MTEIDEAVPESPPQVQPVTSPQPHHQHAYKSRRRLLLVPRRPGAKVPDRPGRPTPPSGPGHLLQRTTGSRCAAPRRRRPKGTVRAARIGNSRHAPLLQQPRALHPTTSRPLSGHHRTPCRRRRVQKPHGDLERVNDPDGTGIAPDVSHLRQHPRTPLVGNRHHPPRPPAGRRPRRPHRSGASPRNLPDRQSARGTLPPPASPALEAAAQSINRNNQVTAQCWLQYLSPISLFFNRCTLTANSSQR